MRQLNLNNQYAELVCVLPQQGITTIFRGLTFAEALAFRCNHALRTFQGSMVRAVETRYDQPQKTGLLLKHKDKGHRS
jgi:hypothetical protein